MDSKRKEFERVHCGGNQHTVRKNEHGEYVLPSVQDAWAGWQAALASLQPAQEPVADFKGWYCAHCRRGVDASEVTYNEQHAICGRVITDDVPPATQKSADDKRELLHEFVNLCFQCARYERPSTDWIAAGDELLRALATE